MKIKVCGMKQSANIEALGKLPIDFVGFIFYAKSPRYAAVLNPVEIRLDDSKKRVGVFVNETMEQMQQLVQRYKLDLIQLHGNESPEFCKSVKDTLGIPVIKALSIAEANDIDQTKAYKDVCDYFLFDTKTPQYGGSGKKFDWSILNAYHLDKPFFLSGGISENDVNEIKELAHPQLYALDLNSKFELEAGLKDTERINQFIKKLNDE